MQINNQIISEYLEKGLIRVQKHPVLDLRILNYSTKTQWERLWDAITIQCRGLVVDGEGNIVARCMPKFFNLHELEPLGIEIPNLPFSVLEKEDGSLLQLFYYDKQWVVSSKGSFTSDHVGWAWDILHKKHQETLNVLEANKTMLHCNFVFELIVPQGRIVRDYGDTEELILLTIINNKNGKEIEIEGKDHYFTFPVVKKYNGISDYKQLSKMIADDHEGFVLRFQNGFRMKIKGEEYLRLHKAITNLTSFDVWEAYCLKIPFEKFIEPFPDEMFDWINNVWQEIEICLNEKFEQIATEYWRLNREILVKNIIANKKIAEVLKTSKINFSLLMAYHKGQIDIIVESLLRDCKPKFEKCWMK